MNCTTQHWASNLNKTNNYAKHYWIFLVQLISKQNKAANKNGPSSLTLTSYNNLASLQKLCLAHPQKVSQCLWPKPVDFEIR